MPDVAELIARVEKLEATQAITRTLHQYGHTIGTGDESGFLACFTEDGALDLRRREMESMRGTVHPQPDVQKTAGNIVFSGQKELHRFISQHPRPPARYHKHIVIDPVIDIAGPAASVVSFFMRLDCSTEGVPFLTAFGRYLDKMVRRADGHWQFRERIAEIQSRGPDPV